MAILPLIISFVVQFALVFGVIFVDCMFIAFQMAGTGELDPNALAARAMDGLNDSLMLVTLMYHILGLLIFGLWYYFGCCKRRVVSPTKVFTKKSLGISLLAGFSMSVAATGLLGSAEYVLPDLIRQYEELMEAAGLGNDPLIIFASVLVAPIGEELLCRGVIFHYAGKVVKGMKNQKAAFWIANTIQALLFGIMHANLVQGAYAFLMGLCLGWLRARYHSLYPGMAAHFAVNFTSTFILGFLFMGLPESLPTYVIALFVGVAATALSMWWGMEKEAVQDL